MKRGLTLVEVMVVLGLMALVIGMSAFGLGELHQRREPESNSVVLVRRARAQAIRTGQPVRLPFDSHRVVLVLPDGRALGPGLDPLTGEPTDAP